MQEADDTMVFTSSEKIESAVESLKPIVNNICDFFEKQQLTLNADKTEFITFRTTKKNKKYKNTNLIGKDEIIRSSSTIKYLRVYLDQNLTFQEEVKHILRNTELKRSIPSETIFLKKFAAIECPRNQSSPLPGS